MSQAHQKEIWKQQASRWEHVGPPTRPTAQDGQLMLDMTLPALPAGPAVGSHPHIVVLGVTPEVVQLAWPETSIIRAFDMSAEMIARMWCPPGHAQSQVTQSRWQALPLEDASVEIVVGDGSLTALQGMDECQEVLREIARVLKPGGRLALRCFVRPPVAEKLETIATDVAEKRIRHFGSLKWRLAMALCHHESATVRPMDIRRAFNDLFHDRQALHRTLGWSADTIDTIDAYEGMEGCFTFMTLAQLQAISRSLFNIETIKQGSYELAERCPTIGFTTLD